jgi:tetratricopeptide (TPR) repeat protein
MFASLKEILDIMPLHNVALERVFICVDLAKNFKESIAYHNTLLEVNPYNFLAWYNLGHAYACTGEYEKAISSMEYSFIINKDFELAYLDCADLCIQTKNHTKALAIFEEANNYFGPDSEILVEIANCHLSMDNLLSAKANLFSALRLDSYNDEIFFYLGQCYLKEKASHSAISAFKKAIKLENNREEYYEGLALAYVQIGDNANAVVYYELATEIAPEQEHLWYQLASLLVKLDRIDEALDVLDNAENDAVGPELLYCRAVCLSLIGRKKEALVILDEALIDNFDMHNKLFELDPSLKFDKDILSIIHYYEGESKM